MTKPPSEGEAACAIARRIVGMGMAAPAIVFLESARPLAWVMGQGVRVLEPLLSLFVRPEAADSLAATLEDRSGVDRLLREIERLLAEGDDGSPA